MSQGISIEPYLKIKVSDRPKADVVYDAIISGELPYIIEENELLRLLDFIEPNIHNNRFKACCRNVISGVYLSGFNSFRLIRDIKTRNVVRENRRNPSRVVYSFQFNKGRKKVVYGLNASSDSQVIESFWEYVCDKTFEHHIQYCMGNKDIASIFNTIRVPDDDYLFNDCWSSYIRAGSCYRDYGRRYRFFLRKTLDQFYS